MSVKLNVRMEMPGKEPKEFSYDFDQDVITLGRDSNNDIQIPLTTVSRNHAKIIHEGNEYFLEDLKSTHGTTHNQKPVGSGGKKLLRNGDSIELMHFKITFTSEADKPLETGQSERTEMLARRMVQEVLSSIGGQEHPYLRVMNGPEEGKRFELSDGVGEVVIGRATECDFAINDANISRRHAIVRKDWSGITIDDLGSKNGVVINDKKIEKASGLKDSDEISLGAVKLVFIDPTASMLGKLDDLPVFQANQEEAPAAEEEAAASGSDNPQVDVPSGEVGEPAAAAQDPDGPAAAAGDAEGGENSEGAPQGDEAPPKTRGLSEYLVFAAVGLVVLGLVALGVVVAIQM